MEMNDLDKLIEAVEGGVGIANTTVFDDMDKWAWEAYVNAMEGSLDAAKALHEALLPGWIWERRGSVMVVQHWDVEFSHGDTDNPARAWLICILKAYRAQVQQ